MRPAAALTGWGPADARESRVLDYLVDVARALGVSQPTAREYFDIAYGSFLWRTVPAFEKSPLKRIVKHPKGYLRDTGLLHHFLRVNSREELLGHPRMGQSWEGMVVEELLRGLAAKGMACEYFH